MRKMYQGHHWPSELTVSKDPVSGDCNAKV